MDKETKIALGIFIALIVGILFGLYSSLNKVAFEVELPVFQKQQKVKKEELATTPTKQVPKEKIHVNEIILPNIEPVTIYANKPQEYDYKTKKEVFSGRLNEIKNIHKEFFKQDYELSKKVFGRVQDRMPWWGFNGLVCLGNASGKGNKGLSEESRFIENPLFLMGVDTNYVYTLPSWKCDNIYPAPYKLVINPKGKLFEAEFKMSEYEKLMNEKSYSTYGRVLKDYYFYTLDSKNARDLGYNYAFIPQYENIEFEIEDNVAATAQKFNCYIHIGRSCGLPEGCNNGSGYELPFHFKVLKYPAYATVYLYKNKPKNKNVAPDLVYKMYFN